MKATSSSNRVKSYEETIDALNNLQSSPDKSVRQRDNSNKLQRTIDFLERSGVSLIRLDDLSVIHVTGTKGKGSTCSYCESILRLHGLNTGLYTSPHLVHVNERIRINSIPINESKFVKYFWDVYDKLYQNVEDGLPTYFEMLTIIAFNVFVNEKIDVAIIEVGIGGEYDVTNVLRNVALVGISSLGYDHTTMLGNTLEEIAWHKAGIMKKGCQAFTVEQPPEALKILVNRSKEKECALEIIDSVPDYLSKYVKTPYKIYKLNMSLALKLALAYLKLKDIPEDLKLTQKALETNYWPGRYQVLKMNKVVYYLDGAHTEDSIKYCVEWFSDKITTSNSYKALIFNSTGNRNSKTHLQILQKIGYDKVFFVPNVSWSDKVHLDFVSNKSSKCEMHKDLWLELAVESGSQPIRSEVLVLPSVNDALLELNDNKQYDLLVTGSLHLIGAILNIINPKLEYFQ